MGALQSLEKTIGGWYKNAPKMSDASKETLVKIWPWLALIGGVLYLLSAINLFRWANMANDINSELNEFYRAIGASNVVESRFTMWIWLALAFIVVEGILLLVAYPKLKKREKKGWDLIFLVALLNVVYAVITLFMGYYGGFFSLLWNLLITAVVFWLLFSTREKYKGAHTPAPKE